MTAGLVSSESVRACVIFLKIWPGPVEATAGAGLRSRWRGVPLFCLLRGTCLITHR